MREEPPELPFWLVSQHEHSLNPAIQLLGDFPRAAHIFTTAERLIAYMMAHHQLRWAVNLVTDREGVIMAMADLHRQKMDTLCIDPDPDGTGGEIMRISDVVGAYRF
jgi:hypothetical protein